MPRKNRSCAELIADLEAVEKSQYEMQENLDYARYIRSKILHSLKKALHKEKRISIQEASLILLFLNRNVTVIELAEYYKITEKKMKKIKDRIYCKIANLDYGE